MKKQSGRIAASSIFFVLLAVCIAFFAFKYFQTGFIKSDIKKGVFNLVGERRSINESDLEGMRRDIANFLKEKGVSLIDDPDDRADGILVYVQGQNIIFSYTYEIVTDYLVTKKKERIKIQDQISLF